MITSAIVALQAHTVDSGNTKEHTKLWGVLLTILLLLVAYKKDSISELVGWPNN